MSIPRRRAPWWRILLTCTVILALGGLVYFFSQQGLERSDKFGSVFSTMIGATTLWLTWRQELQERWVERRQIVAQVDTDADELAAEVLQQWESQWSNHELHKPEPLRLRWSTSGRPSVADYPEAVAADTVGGRVLRARLDGHLGEVVEKFLALPLQRMVLLGEPGSGKSVLAITLTLGLLRRRANGSAERVPVLLSIASWDPEREHLHDWIAGQLADQYYGGHEEIPRALLNAEKILPVLDGLDEISHQARAWVIDGLDRATVGRHPLVVTCRGNQYEQLTASSQSVLAAAAVVELEPLTADEAADYLQRSAPPGDKRWTPVCAHLRAEPIGPLACTLSTPLMIFLARMAYSDEGADPGQLADPAQFPTQEVLERHLLEALVPARFHRRPTAAGAGQRRSWEAKNAEKWLRFLACHLAKEGTRDLAWWKLERAVPRWVLGLFFGIVGGALVGWGVAQVFGAAVGFWVGLGSGAIFGFGGEVVEAIWGGRVNRSEHVPVRAVLHKGGRFRLLTANFLAGGLGGLGFGFASWLWDKVGILAGSAAFVAGLGTVVLVTGLADSLRGPVQIAVLSPRSLLTGDRGMAFLRSVGLSVGVTLGILCATGPDDMITLALGIGLVAALAGIGDTAWGFFVLVRCWLALQRKLPLRLMCFLEDSYDQGILRQFGAVYQFRHVRLQDHYAEH